MIVVEVLGRRGEVTQQVRLASLPAVIGRGWSSDVVLGDPMVDASHARIVADETGALAIEDLGSVNGLHTDATRTKVPRIALNGVTQVRIGRTWLRIARTGDPVPAAIPDLAPSGKLAGLLASPRAMLLVFVIGIGFTVLQRWLGAWQPDPDAKILGQTVIAAAGVAAWAALWSLIGRLRAQQLQFLQHNTVAWLALLGLAVTGIAEAWLNYLWPSAGWISTLVLLVATPIVILAITAHLGMVSTAPRRKRLALAAGLVATAAVLLVLVADASKNDFSSSNVTIAAQLEPLPAALIPAGTIDDFVKATADVKKKIDEKAKD
jgi:hypothetical protein